jgi:hypothetical protein
MMVLGKHITLSMPNGEKRRAQFAIVELAEVLASHDEQTFAPSKGYPTNAQGQNINDRNYADDKLAQQRVQDNAKNLDPYRLLSTSRTPSGSPIVAGQLRVDKWIVVSGNNRTMSTKLAARQYPDHYQDYKQALEEELPAFGIEPKAISKFQQPFLVRIDYDFPAFQTRELAKYNQSTMKGKRAVDKTIERSNSLRENPLCKTRIPLIIDEYERMSEFFSDRIAQKTMLEALLNCNLITEQSIPQYYEEGYFTTAGKELVESVLAGIILDKAALKAAERDGIKQARRVVVYAMPVLIENSTLQGEANLVNHINEAILYLNEVKSSGLPFDQHINQGAMFQERKFHPWAIYLSRLMQLGQRKFKAAVKSFNSSIKQSAGAALFADQAVSSKEAFAAYIIEPLPGSEQKLIQQFANQDKTTSAKLRLLQAKKAKKLKLIALW